MARVSAITPELMFQSRGEGRRRAEQAFSPGVKFALPGRLGLWPHLPPIDREELEETALAAAKCRWGELEAEHLRRTQPIVLASKVSTPSGRSGVVVREDQWDVAVDRTEARTALAQVLEAECRVLEAGYLLPPWKGRDPIVYVAFLERALVELRAGAQ